MKPSLIPTSHLVFTHPECRPGSVTWHVTGQLKWGCKYNHGHLVVMDCQMGTVLGNVLPQLEEGNLL